MTVLPSAKVQKVIQKKKKNKVACAQDMPSNCSHTDTESVNPYPLIGDKKKKYKSDNIL